MSDKPNCEATQNVCESVPQKPAFIIDYTVPDVVWNSAAEKDRTHGAKEYLTHAKNIVDYCWNHMPCSARTFMGGFCKPIIVLHNKPTDDLPNLCDDGSTDDTTIVEVNVNLFDLKNDPDRKLGFAMVRQFARIYMRTLTEMARQQFLTSVENTPDPICNFTDYKDAALFAFHLSADLDEDSEYSPNTPERLADAVVLAWGFGADYARLCTKRNMSADELRQFECDNENEFQLGSDLLRVHRIWTTGEDQ